MGADLYSCQTIRPRHHILYHKKQQQTSHIKLYRVYLLAPLVTTNRLQEVASVKPIHPLLNLAHLIREDVTEPRHPAALTLSTPTLPPLHHLSLHLFDPVPFLKNWNECRLSTHKHHLHLTRILLRIWDTGKPLGSLLTHLVSLACHPCLCPCLLSTLTTSRYTFLIVC